MCEPLESNLYSYDVSLLLWRLLKTKFNLSKLYFNEMMTLYTRLDVSLIFIVLEMISRRHIILIPRPTNLWSFSLMLCAYRISNKYSLVWPDWGPNHDLPVEGNTLSFTPSLRLHGVSRKVKLTALANYFFLPIVEKLLEHTVR